MNNSKKRITFIELLKIIVKRVRISTLILLLITFASTSFAWFIYATKISTGITAHIEAWNILFTTEDNLISEYVSFTIPDLYPGMEDYEDSITAYNLGERQAAVSFEVVSAKILGVTYTIDGSSLTSSMMVNKLANDFPFKITMNLTDEIVSSSTGKTTFTLKTVWPYESGNDELDTYWGSKSYEFSSNNPDSPSIEITVRISAIQDV